MIRTTRAIGFFAVAFAICQRIAKNRGLTCGHPLFDLSNIRPHRDKPRGRPDNKLLLTRRDFPGLFLQRPEIA